MARNIKETLLPETMRVTIKIRMIRGNKADTKEYIMLDYKYIKLKNKQINL